MRGLWFLGGALIASAATTCFFLLAGTDDPQEESWRRRALEAERKIAQLRERLEAVAAERLEPAPARAPARSPRPAQVRAVEALESTSDAPETLDHWEALLDGVIEIEAERLGRHLDPDQRQTLSQALKQVRSAAIALEEGSDPDNAREARLTRTLVVLRADRVIRDLLGIGLSELVRDLDPGAVEEVHPVLE